MDVGRRLAVDRSLDMRDVTVDVAREARGSAERQRLASAIRRRSCATRIDARLARLDRPGTDSAPVAIARRPLAEPTALGAEALDAVTRLLSDLVAIPSVNPMGRPLDGPGFLEGGMTDYLEGWFRELGVAVERQTVAPGRDNVLARYEAPGLEPDDPLRRPPGHRADRRDDDRPVRARIERGPALRPRARATSRAGWRRCSSPSPGWSRERPEGSASVLMACTVDEEFTHIGSSHLAGSPHGADLAIVAEPTRLELVDRHKGAVRWKVRHPRASPATARRPSLGAQRDLPMARVVAALADYARRARASRRPTRSSGRRASRSAGSRGGRASTSCPTGARSRSTGGSSRARTSRPCPGRVWDYLRAARTDVDGRRVPAAVGSTCRRCRRPPRRRPLAGAGRATRSRAALGRQARGRGVPYGTDAGPLGESGGCPASCSGRATSPRRTPRTSGSSSIRSARGRGVLSDRRATSDDGATDGRPGGRVGDGRGGGESIRGARGVGSEDVEGEVIALVELLLVPARRAAVRVREAEDAG